MTEPRILEAFQTMWGPFPEPVMLVHRDRTVLAANDLARQIGIPTGIKCHTLNPLAEGKHCQHCKANQALNSGKTVCKEELMGDRYIRGYWMPLTEAPDLYVHFGIGTAEALAQNAAACAPQA
ncbi:hypothetical protein [Geothrix sp. 21YS21S-4]|uniref:hypothetical protein n=1 Tax=Geothrix sp. 21YS21S-4 TaxID=3068889 RepID=UPI0027BABB47|nr:hypothetical protein [Geothrix sp. 21YS21S-4]